MAARTGAGTGVVVGLVVFVLSTIFLLVLTIVFYSKQQDAEQERRAALAELDKFASRLDQNSDEVKAIMTNRGGQSAVRYLLTERQEIMNRVVGDRNADPERLQSALATYAPNSQDAVYAQVLQGMQNDLNAARQEIEGYQVTKDTLEQQLEEQKAMLVQAEAARKAELEAVRNTIQQFISDVQTYGADVTDTKARMLQMVESLESQYNQQVDSLERTIDQTRADLALAQQELELYRQIREQALADRQDPSRQVDGTILNPPDSQANVYISRGSRDHIRLGMTFEVYDDATMLRADEFGNLPRGKASLEVIDVGDTTSTAKVTRTSPGRPVVRNDVIANAVYDPSKTYLFLVHGMFDVNGDGRPSDEETGYIRSLITDWGGKIAEGDQIRGDMDFLLLGEQPMEPAPLPANPTTIQVDLWVKQKAAVDKYKQLLSDAQKAHIPVLNQNRFFTLIGHTYQ